MTDKRSLIPSEIIERHIFLIRGQKVMLDHDLAKLYGVETKTLNQAVKRNTKRFPHDFMFQLNFQEVSGSRSQFVTLKRGQNIKYRPYAFTEHGILMLSSVLNSERAVQVNIEIMRAFVKLREMLASHKDLASKLAEMEKRYDSQFKVVFDAIRELMTPPEPKPRRIGFQSSLAP
jgi:phage regulator Rha-like protein